MFPACEVGRMLRRRVGEVGRERKVRKEVRESTSGVGCGSRGSGPI